MKDCANYSNKRTNATTRACSISRRKEAIERADTFDARLEIDDKVLKDILGIVLSRSPYVFAQIPADILGQVYERFLGKVIRLTAGHQAKVEEKPEVRKAGGVYYTPTYIVDYIVTIHVGKLLEGKTPEEAAHLKSLTLPAVRGLSFWARFNICGLAFELVLEQRP